MENNYRNNSYSNVEELTGRPVQAVKAAQATLMRNVYLWMTLALAITGFTSYIVASSPALLSKVVPMMWILLIAEVGLVWGIAGAINRMSAPTATMLFIIYSVLNGATLSPILLVYTQESIANVFFITAGTFGVMSLYGLLTKNDLSKVGSICFMALIGLIIATVVNMFVQSSGLMLILSYAGVLIFVGLTAYDTWQIKKNIQENALEVNDLTQRMALLGALSLYLDFVNLFLYLLRIFGNRNN